MHKGDKKYVLLKTISNQTGQSERVCHGVLFDAHKAGTLERIKIGTFYYYDAERAIELVEEHAERARRARRDSAAWARESKARAEAGQTADMAFVLQELRNLTDVVERLAKIWEA